MSGWDLVAMAEERIGDFWSMTPSQVYRELARMAEAGYVAAGQRGVRDRQPYSITDDGRTAFSEWAEREPGLESIRFPLLMALCFGHQIPPQRLAHWLARHRGLHADRLERYERSARPPNPYQAATLDFGISYERAVLDWFDALPTEITNPSS